MTPEDENRVREIIQENSILHQSQFTPGIVKRRFLADKPIVFGLAADRPTDSSSGTFVWFSTDTDVLSCYNGSSWVGTTLT